MGSVAGSEPTLFEWLGGARALHELTRVFYSRYVTPDPLIGPLFADMPADHPDRVAEWLGEVFGGPAVYSRDHGGYAHMISQHVGRQLSEAQRARWASLMLQAADDVALPADPEFRSAFVSYIEWGTRLALENSQSDARPPLKMPMPHWNWGTAGPPGSRVTPSRNLPQAARPSGDRSALPARELGAPVSFSTHIQVLFREQDRQSMLFAFDLWSHDDVTANANAILHRLEHGSMPCDGSWPDERVVLFRDWIAGGCAA